MEVIENCPERRSSRDLLDHHPWTDMMVGEPAGVRIVQHVKAVALVVVRTVRSVMVVVPGAAHIVRDVKVKDQEEV